MNRRAVMEVVMVIVTGAVHIVFENFLAMKLPFILAASLGWLVYVVIRCRQDRMALSNWGFRADNLSASWRFVLPFALVAVMAMAVTAAIRHTLFLPPQFLILILIYPVWGVVQQFLIQAMVARNLNDLGWPRPVVLTLCAALFAMAHWPDPALMGLTFIAGMAWTFIYLRVPNLIPLGICHGVLGALAYYLVLNRDPWMEFFRRSVA